MVKTSTARPEDMPLIVDWREESSEAEPASSDSFPSK
jgi:hypothetical protein